MSLPLKYLDSHKRTEMYQVQLEEEEKKILVVGVEFFLGKIFTCAKVRAVYSF